MITHIHNLKHIVAYDNNFDRTHSTTIDESLVKCSCFFFVPITPHILIVSRESFARIGRVRSCLHLTTTFYVAVGSGGLVSSSIQRYKDLWDSDDVTFVRSRLLTKYEERAERNERR